MTKQYINEKFTQKNRTNWQKINFKNLYFNFPEQIGLVEYDLTCMKNVKI